MTQKQIIYLIEITLDEKIKQNEKFIRYSFFEVNVKYNSEYNLSKKDKATFLKLLKIKLENNNYRVYLQGQKFEYNNSITTVQDNEELIAIKK